MAPRSHKKTIAGCYVAAIDEVGREGSHALTPVVCSVDRAVSPGKRPAGQHVNFVRACIEMHRPPGANGRLVCWGGRPPQTLGQLPGRSGAAAHTVQCCQWPRKPGTDHIMPCWNHSATRAAESGACGPVVPVSERWGRADSGQQPRGAWGRLW